MIRVVKQGDYQLIKTHDGTKILILSDKGNYVWIDENDISEISVTSYKKQHSDCLLASGKYRVYKVKEETRLEGSIHLELSSYKGMWKGYLLHQGLPSSKKTHNQIIPVSEVITKSAIGYFL